MRPGVAHIARHTGEIRLTDEHDAWNELLAYTLSHGDPAFIHQHVVDAGAAYFAGPATKPIGLAFGLIGLYLHLERGMDGRTVQRMHMLLARRSKQWPALPQPDSRGAVRPSDVMAAAAGAGRDRMIDAWCESVWRAYAGSRLAVIALLAQHGIT